MNVSSQLTKVTKTFHKLHSACKFLSVTAVVIAFCSVQVPEKNGGIAKSGKMYRFSAFPHAKIVTRQGPQYVKKLFVRSTG
jgi:hypothetical protein